MPPPTLNSEEPVNGTRRWGRSSLEDRPHCRATHGAATHDTAQACAVLPRCVTALRRVTAARRRPSRGAAQRTECPSAP